ncbi:hypothetical protein NQZ79_g3407 [Umbelopsis isabellina]|nr:hypothetical protein NQZ79_g3407 [Umbelopsis isabellina]
MGCCSSSEASSEEGGYSSRNGGFRAGNKPFKRKGIKWTANPPITEDQLQQQRDTFWDTAPSYEGRPEIWQALRAATDEMDLSLAQSILDAAGITMPTGNPADGCYDELGNEYTVPVYCLVNPTNLLPSPTVSNGTHMASTSQPYYNQETYSPPLQKLSDKDADNSTPADEKQTIDSGSYPITIRLSTSIDINTKIATDGSDNIGKLRSRLMDLPELSFARESHYLKFIYLGRILDDHVKLYDEDSKVENDRNNAKIPKNGVLQALVAKKSR